MPSFQPVASAVCTVLDDGGVVLHLETKFYYSLNLSGLAIWTALEDGCSDPAAALAGRFPDAPGREEAVRSFLQDLEKEKLVEAAGEKENGMSPTSIEGLSEWTPPVLTRHAVPLSQILSNPFDPCVPLAE